jgi:hypothetical protein
MTNYGSHPMDRALQQMVWFRGAEPRAIVCEIVLEPHIELQQTDVKKHRETSIAEVPQLKFHDPDENPVENWHTWYDHYCPCHIAPNCKFNCCTVALHGVMYKNILVSTWANKKKTHHYSFAPWQFPPLPPQHLDHEKYHCNTGSATIAPTATSPATILPLGLVRFVLFLEKSHHFYSVNFVTCGPSWTEARQMII